MGNYFKKLAYNYLRSFYYHKYEEATIKAGTSMRDKKFQSVIFYNSRIKTYLHKIVAVNKKIKTL